MTEIGEILGIGHVTKTVEVPSVVTPHITNIIDQMSIILKGFIQKIGQL